MGLFKNTWKDSSGRTRKSRTWSLEYYDADGRRHRVALKIRDKRAAELKASEILRAVELGEAGVQTFAATRTTSMDELLEQYQAELLRRGRSYKKHVRQTMTRLGTLFEGHRHVQDVTSEGLRQALARIGERRQPKTVNEYRSAAHAFFAWLVREGRWSTNPVDGTAPIRVVEKSFERRSLTPEEVEHLISVAPPYRGRAYLCALLAGLRRNEISTLRVADVDLEAGTIRVLAKNAKNRREAVLPLHPELAEALREKVAGRAPGERLLEEGVPRNTTLYRDLERADIERETAAGVIDFHSLRVSFASNLARTGCPLALAQRLLRHSDPRLTSTVYTSLALQDGVAAVGQLSATPRGKTRGEPRHFNGKHCTYVHDERPRLGLPDRPERQERRRSASDAVLWRRRESNPIRGHLHGWTDRGQSGTDLAPKQPNV